MIPRLSSLPATLSVYAAFCAELRARGFAGELTVASADRTALATDNSIYQLTPQAVAFPDGTDDLVRIAKLLGEDRFAEVRVAPRGGGTGTNGQSLTEGLVVDLSRHMNRVLAIDPERRTARVEAGVVKDQLNAALKPYGLFFAPELSTSNRATIGGMISTDACGQGSCLYGKTRNHVLALTTVLLDGAIWTSRPLDDSAFATVAARPDRVGTVHRLVDRIERENRATIAERFPKLNRSLTGYDLAHIRDAEGRFDLNAILCGAEGTLGFLVEAELNVLPIPRHVALVNIRYDSFDAALRDARALVAVKAASIETVDSKVLDLARTDLIWHEVRDYFPDDPEGPAAGVNLVEILADDPDELEIQLERVTTKLSAEGRQHGRRGFTVARSAAFQSAPGGPTDAERTLAAAAEGGARVAEDGDQSGGEAAAVVALSVSSDPVESIWSMRKKAVGLLGATQGGRRPIPFVEDTAVPPEHLADYIVEFRAALDRRGLAYGMFGHVDAGVLHVRPAIDMTDPEQVPLIRAVTDEVVALTQKYGGVLWGEHGKGVRSEFVPSFFGPLYPCLQEIKAAFDPRFQLNPGKIAAPADGALLRIDAVPIRGERDRIIPPAIRDAYDNALHCNGNGACFNWDPDDAMCPSWKGTRERRHSPKGRAQLMRAWLRQLTLAGVDPLEEARRQRGSSGWRGLPGRAWNMLAPRGREDDFSHDVKEAMDGCLACKSCVGQCPIKVNVPAFRSKFLELYYGRYLRPVRHHVVASLEALVPWLAKAPRLVNLGTSLGVSDAIGLVHTPKLSGLNLGREIARRGVRFATEDALSRLATPERLTSVVIVQDAFTSYYETPVLLDLVDLLIGIGIRPWLAPYRPNGKPLHVHGFLGQFERLAATNAAELGRLAATGIDLIGLDPSMTLTYRSEYAEALPGRAVPRVQLVQEWLAGRLEAREGAPITERYWLLPHCTERTTAQPALVAWSTIFRAFGLDLATLPSGCCGMAGTYGHEAEHRAMSERIYGLSWANHVAEKGRSGRLMADGYSCRSQAKIIDGVRLPHPVSILRAHLSASDVAGVTIHDRVKSAH